MKNGVKRVSKTDWIEVFGAREHNLKNIDVAIPKGTLTVITGPSGSGKSSLALDILFTEGKRRYMESLSSYARQFLGIAKKPDVDRIEGLCPAIAIEQKTVSTNPRSTVGTITEIHDYLRVLFARIGKVHCPDCKVPIAAESADSITDLLVKNFAGQVITIAAPIANQKKGEFVHELTKLFENGFYRFRIDGESYKFKLAEEIQSLKLKKTYKHTIDLLIDAIEVNQNERSRICEAVETAFKHGNGSCVVIVGDKEYFYSSSNICLRCSGSVPELEPRLFSFNSPIGACEKCHGLGIIHEWPWQDDDPDAWKANYPDFFGDKYAHKMTCGQCLGKRLNKFACAVTLGEKDIYDIGDLSIKDLQPFLQNLPLDERSQE
ncbi:MAG: hypothetical protein Q8Q25_00135, partial [bacterium]|nr:hypothetical protein [bacterium]